LSARRSASSRRLAISFSMSGSAGLSTTMVSQRASEEDRKAYYAATRGLHKLVGVIATGWGHIEQRLDETLWLLAGVEVDAGACLTSQYLSVSNRLTALEALLRLRGIPDGFIKDKISPFGKRCGSLAQRRNRAVHDPIAVDKVSGLAVVSRVIARQRLHRDLKPASHTSYKNIANDIFDALDDWLILEDEIFALLPAYDRKSRQ